MPSNRKTLIVSHNAGGAAVLAAWVQAELNPSNCDFLLQGPALGIFIGEFTALNLVCLNTNIRQYQRIITATSAADTQWETVILARARADKIPTISFLDHWTNYQSRFLWRGQYVYPECIYVQDEYALQIANQIPNYPPVCLVPDYYLRKQAAAIHLARNALLPEAALAILFVSEPSSNPLYSEFDVLRQFLIFIESDPAPTINIRLRLHPREDGHKYQTLICAWRTQLSARDAARLQIAVSQGTSLIEDCAWSQWVVGCQTMAMVVALRAGLRVSSCLPALVEHCALPHAQIERLFPFAGNGI